MGLREEYENAVRSIRAVLRTEKYKLISLISGAIIFLFLYYLLFNNAAGNDVWISVMMSGAGFVTFSIVASIFTATLSGILLSMLIFKFNSYRKLENKGIFGFVGSGVAAFGVGCPTCGAFLFGLIGMPLALMYLPFKGLELQIFGILILLLSVYFTGKSIGGICKIK